MLSPKRWMRAVFERAENGFDGMFTPAWNPFYQLGALGWFYYWIVVVSGIYVYIFFDTGVTEAYESLEQITHSQWYAGGIMRSLHRYASDALVVVVALHLLREYSLDRLRGHRWFTWLTGVPLLWFVYVCGVTGYWLVWDVLAQYVAIGTTEWLDALPFFGESIAANFASSSTLSGRFFTLLVYMHIAIPLFMLFSMWVHIQRHSEARTNPTRGLGIGALLSLIVLSLAYPAVSQAPADLDAVPASVALDWYYLALYPFLDVIPGGQMWIIVVSATIVLAALPWVPPAQAEPVAVVDLDNCNGCGRCYLDCPFSAITMAPRSDGSAYLTEAVVDATKCLSCGICAGACPTATPFRRMSELVPGIQLPHHGIADIRDRTVGEAEALSGDARVMIFSCDHAAAAETMRTPSSGVVAMPCVGMLPPSFVDFVISRGLAEGVVINGCHPDDCYFRLGAEWTRQRLAGQRDPYLRKRVTQERVELCWGRASRVRQATTVLDAFKERLARLHSTRKADRPHDDGELADA